MSDDTLENPRCVKCASPHVYRDGHLLICPECAHEWNPDEKAVADGDGAPVDRAVRDANGNALSDGDSVVIVKDLKIKGASSAIKGGTKIRGIRIIDAVDGHNISCKIDGVGSVNLKSEFVKKA